MISLKNGTKNDYKLRAKEVQRILVLYPKNTDNLFPRLNVKDCLITFINFEDVGKIESEIKFYDLFIITYDFVNVISIDNFKLPLPILFNSKTAFLVYDDFVALQSYKISDIAKKFKDVLYVSV
jgi:hypothetical protein